MNNLVTMVGSLLRMMRDSLLRMMDSQLRMMMNPGHNDEKHGHYEGQGWQPGDVGLPQQAGDEHTEGDEVTQPEDARPEVGWGSTRTKQLLKHLELETKKLISTIILLIV